MNYTNIKILEVLFDACALPCMVSLAVLSLLGLTMCLCFVSVHHQQSASISCLSRCSEMTFTREALPVQNSLYSFASQLLIHLDSSLQQSWSLQALLDTL